MSIVQQLLLEFQSKNYLYHFTNLANASRIIDENKLEGSKSFSVQDFMRTNLSSEEWEKKVRNFDYGELFRGVSFTRNRRLPAVKKQYIGGAMGQIVLIAFVFDRNKLTNKYKLFPYDVHHHNYQSDDEKKHSSIRVLDEEIVIGNVENVRSLTEFVYIDKEYAKQTDMREIYVENILEFYETYHRYFDFKVFDKANFQDIDIDIDNWDGELKFERGSVELELYRQIFE